jgi:signal transduction histidine kinase
MRLADFIEGNRERIVDAWQRYAETLPPFEGQASVMELRDHGGRMLDAIVGSMRSPSLPLPPVPEAATPEQALVGGAEHGLQRHAAGLSLIAMTSEFRALRAVVLRLWAGAGFVRSPQAFDDLVTFNESLDSVTAAAVLAFTQAVERDRALMMGIVAHDLRGPLHTAAMAMHVLARRHPAADADDCMGQMRRSLARMMPMVDDLMGVAAAGLRSRMIVQPQTMDLAALAAEIAAEVAAEFPAQRFVVDAPQPWTGDWDRARLGQLLSNLLRNAAVHGDRNGIVRVRLTGDTEQVILSVQNFGPVIPEAERQRLFSPTARGVNAPHGAHLGLGLYIVQEIAQGHGGRVELNSDAEHGTVISVFLPLSTYTDAVSAEVSTAGEAALFAAAGGPGRPDPMV